mmetsp:Transcript_25243/g.77831  ORF Transcript_25243/g.77831 Transcript_25243/m.77831 type:complete len:89 (-) Transcript_25243:182-448(-)
MCDPVLQLHASQTVGRASDDVAVSRVYYREHGDAKVFTACGSQVNVGAIVMNHLAFGQHGIVFDLALAKRRRVISDENKLRFVRAKRL